MQHITAKELSEKNDESILILDIREADKFNDWHIRGSKNVDVYMDIWENNLGNIKHKLSNLPKGRKIVTVCNAGVTSQKASEILESFGYSTLVLKGGMMGWNALHQSVDVINESDILLKQIIRPGKGCLSYLIGSNSKKECLIVDPSQFIYEYTEIAKELGFAIKAVVETHAHADHVSGAKSLADLTKSGYYISGKDIKEKTGFIHLKNNDELTVGDNKIKVIETPGHTDGSLSLLVSNKAVLTGDTLFLDSIGRPDLGRSRQEAEREAKILYSALNIIKGMDKELIILPAHFTASDKVPVCERLNILLESNNPLKISSEDEFKDYILNNLPVTPPNYEQIKNLNINLIHIPLEDGEKLEFGPNRCASK